MDKKINWFWAHRRNASLHHFSFLMHGLAGKGWSPAVNFHFDNQIVIGIPGKGCYVFYDRDQLSSSDKYKDVQKSIEDNPNFVKDFKRRTDEIFGAIFFKCMAIDDANLKLLSNSELEKLYKDFINAIMIAPIITVQLWGIEACFDDKWIIMKFLQDRLQELGRGRDFQYFKEILSVNVGETVAYTEQKDFYRVASALDKPEIKDLLRTKNINDASVDLKNFPYENEIFEKHIYKYEWVHKEYVSGGWSREKWLELFKDAILNDTKPADKLNSLLDEFKKLNDERQKAIEILKPPQDVLHAINSLSELIAQRDWTKGYFAKTLLSYHKLLSETANRMEIDFEDLFYYTYLELSEYYKNGNILSSDEIASRRNDGFALVIKSGKLKLFTGKKNIQYIIEEEGISEPFEKIINISSFKGMPASRGKITGRARVLEDASRISELKKGDILVTYMTTIEFTPAFRKISGVITDEGGMSSHAAIISREFGIPCIVGTKIATRVLKDGDLVEVDANEGVVRILEKA